MDELACNYNEDANINDGTCDYSCHDIYDYSLSFNNDGSYVRIPNSPKSNLIYNFCSDKLKSTYELQSFNQ